MSSMQQRRLDEAISVLCLAKRETILALGLYVRMVVKRMV